MQIKDYNQQLAKARDDYAEKAKILREDYNENLENLEATHEAREISQRKNYLNQKQELENKVGEIADRYDRSTRDAIEQDQQDYRQRLAQKTSAFEEEMKESRNDMDTRLNDISTSYRKARLDQDKYRDQIIDQKTASFETAQKNRQNFFDTKIDQMARKNRDDFHHFQREQTGEKRDLIQNHRNSLQELVTESNLTRQKVMAENQKEMEILRDNHQREGVAMRDHHSSAIKEVINRKEIEKSDLQNEYQNLTTNIIDRNDKQSDQIHRVNERMMRERENQYASDLQAVTRKSNEMVNSGGRVKNLENENRDLATSYEGKIRNLRAEMEVQGHDAQAEKERMNKEFREQAREQTILADNEKAQVKNELHGFHSELQMRTKDRNEKVVESYKNELTQSRLGAEAKSLDDRAASNARLQEQRVNFSRSIEEMNDKNRATISAIQEINAKEQSELIQQNKRQIHHEREDLKDELSTAFIRKEGSYEKRIENLERDKKAVVESYESRLTNLEKKYTKELEQMRVLMAETRAGDLRDYKRQLEMKEREGAREKMELKQNFDKKLMQVRDRQETQVTKLHERFTQTLDRERVDHARDMKRKLVEAQVNYDRLYDNTQMEKEQLKHQYEVRMEKLRQDRREAEKISATREELA